MKKENVVCEKSFQFAICIVNLHKILSYIPLGEM
jgi:hypothetical protein